MLTFKAEIRKNEMKVGGTFNVKIRVTYNREVKRLATHIFVRTEDLTKDFKLKNPKYIKEADKLVRYYEELCMGLPLEASNLTLSDVLDYIQKEKEKNTPIDFIQFCKDWLTTTEVKGKRNYQTTLNTFIAFLGKDKLNTNQVTKLLMMEFMEYLHKKRAKQVAELQRKGKTARTLFSKSAEVQEATKQLSLPATSSVCMPNSVKPKVGKWKSPMRTKEQPVDSKKLFVV